MYAYASRLGDAAITYGWVRWLRLKEYGYQRGVSWAL
jgi:hypothetical protein